MRDMKCTLGEAHTIPLALSDDEAKSNSDNTLPDISKMIPDNCAYTKTAIESALHNLDTLIQEALPNALKWETIILIFGNLGDAEQVELMFSSDLDTDVREKVYREISTFLIGRPWPSYGDTQESVSSWKLFISAATDKYSRPKEYF